MAARGLICWLAALGIALLLEARTVLQAQSQLPARPGENASGSTRQGTGKAGQPRPALPPAEHRRARLEQVKSWGFQLRLIRFPELAAAPLDLIVIDHAFSAGRRFVHQFTPDLIELAKTKPDGGRRLVLAYLSIGEAERYRFYWDQAWYEPATKPAWLGDLNPVWDGNYLVRFWDPAWQRIILEGPDSYLARIQAAGFDGVYLDRADVHFEWTKERPTAEGDMARFIQRIASLARAQNPGFLIVMQNAEELIAHKSVRSDIDAIAKEDLFFGIDHKATPNDPATVDWSLKLLRQAKRAGKRVFVVEYLDEAKKAAEARARAQAEGFLIHFTSRHLGDLTLSPPDAPPPSSAAPATK